MIPTQLNQQNSIAAPASLQSALQIDANQHLQHQAATQPPAPPPPPPAPPASTGKRRRKTEGNGEEAPAASEPRRLRRSHEACARCRSKKIKCDSKHPRCTACATAGLPCQQEDRHRQTLTPRGHTERLEQQLAQCEALIKRQIPGFALDNIQDILAREGINIDGITPVNPNPSFQYEARPFRPDPGPQPKPFPPMYPPAPHMIHHPPYPPHPMLPYGPAPPYHPQMPIQGPPGAYHHNIHPAFQPGVPYPPPPVMHPQPPPEQPVQTPVAKGIDPNGNDMSNTESLARNFGVSDSVTSGLKLDSDSGVDDISVTPSTLLHSKPHAPRNPSHWVTFTLRRNPANGGGSNTLSIYGPVSNSATIDIWLPEDRKTVDLIINAYFTRLNLHRPVFARKDFEKILNDLYNGVTQVHDPGNLCSIYLIFALGTLSELNHRAVNVSLETKDENLQHLGPAVAKKLMPHDWPEHGEFFERALIVKPDLRVTLSSLQALILLHWYLYIERQGRTLWRLVGSLVRLGVELGLHHDPTTQFHPGTKQHVFTDEESQQRIRLWGIILIHDRGTAILLGRPLAISPSDSNTPHPTRLKNMGHAEISEHFELSHPVADIQGDIINSLYAPNRQAGDTIMRNATRIVKSMSEFRRGMPERYKYYFNGTTDWPIPERSELVRKITEDEGLTLLKIGIARILMLRALFSSKELTYAQKHKALVDAIITSHNIIIIHSQLIQYPDIAFFTSPIPLHIAAMVILYGHISKVGSLNPQVALEDVWLALDMLPRFRWRWERKDLNGGHPLIARLVEQVMGVNLHTYQPQSEPLLMSEPDWDEPTSPVPKSQHTTPILSASSTVYSPSNTTGPAVYGPQQRSMNGPANGSMNRSHSGGSTPPDNKRLADVPSAMFYPFFPEAGASAIADVPTQRSAPSSGGHHTDYSQMWRAAAASQDGYEVHPPQDVSMAEDREVPAQNTGWISMNPRNMPSYPALPQAP